ncbi:MAG TPA: hypothetical protein VGX48_10110 [Pyrinomonadaceae bacterium]|jgi:hypothetical protein|nr:hypothetical protein [Pyrinomonadaceae bacterium]
MNARSLTRPLAAFGLALALCAVALGDTIRLKDGTVIRGQIISFRDQQFTVLIGSGNRGGRRSQMTVYTDDIESIEFDGAGGTADAGNMSQPAEDYQAARPEPARPQPTPARTDPPRPTPGGTANPNGGGQPRANTGTAPASGGEGQFFPVRIRVRADNSANGWTDSGLMVRKGQRLRISASGRVSLGQGRFSTPTGLPRVVDTEKLMRNEPTGALIAVIGDDNDEFIFIGSSRDFYAPRDGRLFLGVNEGNLADNTGTYDALVEVEPVATGGR